MLLFYVEITLYICHVLTFHYIDVSLTYFCVNTAVTGSFSYPFFDLEEEEKAA